MPGSFKYTPTCSGSPLSYNHFMVFLAGVLGAEMRGQLVLCRVELENSGTFPDAMMIITFVFEVGLEGSEQ